MNKTQFLILGLVLFVIIAGAGFFLFNSVNSDKASVAEVQQTQNIGNYRVYEENDFTGQKDKKRVLFFHASWCPTCKVANEDFLTNGDQLPKEVILFKTDYDAHSDLKRKYGITYQHTFVLVDEKGEELKKWNGGGISELIAQTQ